MKSESSNQLEITSDLLDLDECRITSESVIRPKEFLMRFFGKPCFPRKDITTITGPAKSGKTFYTSMVMAAATVESEEPQVLGLRRAGPPLKVMWYDTEQSCETTQEIMTGRIARLVGGSFPDLQFFVFNVRGCTIDERRRMLPLAIGTYKPDMVIIDGIADLVTDINDGPKAVELMQELLGMADAHDCNITAIIHLNRSGEKSNLRGWLGSVMLQKSFEVFNCAKVYQTDVLSVELSTSRRVGSCDTLYYGVDGLGIPVPAAKPDIQPRDARGKFTSRDEAAQEPELKFNREYIVDDPNAEDGRVGVSWVSQLLKARNPKLLRWYFPIHSLFGMHLLRSSEGRESHEGNETICIVPSERTAVILSELFPRRLWLAAMYPANLTEWHLQFLLDRKVVLYPPAGDTGDCWLAWEDIASRCRQRYGLDIEVRDFLSRL